VIWLIVACRLVILWFNRFRKMKKKQMGAPRAQLLLLLLLLFLLQDVFLLAMRVLHTKYLELLRNDDVVICPRGVEEWQEWEAAHVTHLHCILQGAETRRLERSQVGSTLAHIAQCQPRERLKRLSLLLLLS